LFGPGVTVDKTGDTLSKVGDPVSYTFTITNMGTLISPDLVNGTIVDTLLGNLLDPANPFVTSSTCTATLATDASCVIQATRTVLGSDPDPLPNTVTVHYNPEGFPNDITASDDHSVDLFQPGVDVTKTGPAFTKAGDTNNYSVTITNTGSADSPNLVNGTIDDSKVGDLLDPANTQVMSSTCSSTLATGASCTITYTYVTLAGDPDPLVNTVTVQYNPEGFPNDITDSASHSSDVVHPTLTVSKDCLTPEVPPGGTATFDVTIGNTGDVPLIFTTSENEMPGPFTLAAGESSSFQVTMVAGGGPTVDNTVNVTAVLPPSYQLSNTLTGTATDSCAEPPPLARTGTDVLDQLEWSALLLVIGGGILRLARLRRRTARSNA
jgi:hypothetical protein